MRPGIENDSTDTTRDKTNYTFVYSDEPDSSGIVILDSNWAERMD